MASLKDTYTQRQAESESKINDIYSKQYETEASKLKTQYENSLSDKQASLGQIAPQYQTAANNLANSYEQTRRNANLSAMTSGLATGTQQQMQNAYANQYAKNYASLRGQEADALNSAYQDIANLTRDYNNNLATKQAEINNTRDQKLLENANTQRDWYENQAKTMAENYGNFDAYKDIYGESQANSMRATWIAQNPELAYRRGMISGTDYKKMTGKDYEYTSAYESSD